MKKTFKFMAMALAAVVMAGVTVSCDPMDKDDDQQNEQTGGDQTGDENDGDQTTTYTLDGKQWVCPDPTTEGNMAFFFDFGTSIENTLVEGNIYLIPGDYYYTSPFATNNGEYVITSTNATSGTFSYLSYGMEYEYEYFDLTETSVKIKGIKFGEGDEHEYYEFTAAEQTITWDNIM